MAMSLPLLALFVAAPVAGPLALAPAGEAAAAEVTVWNRPVVRFRANVLGVAPEGRAEGAERRIADLPPEALHAEVLATPGVVGGSSVVLVTVGGRPVFTLVEEDLPPGEALSLQAHADGAAAALAQALRARELEQSPVVLARAALFGIAVTLGFALVLALLVRVRRGLLARLGSERGGGRRFVLLGIDVAPVLVGVGETLVKVGAVAFGAALTYAWLTAVLGRFEYTRPWADGLGGYLGGLLSELASGAVGAVPGIFAVVVVVLLARAVSRAVGAVFDGVEAGRLRVPWLEPETVRATRRVSWAVIWGFALVVAYPYIPGSESGVFKGLSVLIGAMLTLGSSNLVNQVMSGLVVTYSRALRPGDYVKIGDVEGTVTHVGALATKVSNLRMEEVTVPNAVVVGTTITNYSRLAGGEGAVASARVTIGYDAPWRQVHALLSQAALGTPGLRRDVEPRVLQRALSDFYVDYQLLVNLERADDRLQVLSDLHAAIQDAFNAAGVQIMSPHFMDQPPGKVVVPPGRWEGEPGRSGPAGG